MERLRRQKDIELVLKSGRKFSSPLLTVFIKRQEDDVLARLAVVVSARVSKRAVIRNRIRRRIREAVRAQLNASLNVPKGIDIVILPRLGVLDAPFTELERHVAAVIR